VTARRQVESDLQESEERFRGAFDFAAIGMALVAPDGRWLRVNASLCRIVGYSVDELLATTFQAITHPDDWAVDADYARRVLDGSLSHYHREKRYFHKDGHIVWILLSTSLVRGADGEPLYCVAQIQDITARKDAEARLKESELRYRTIVDLVPGCVFEGLLADGNPQAFWASVGFERIFGCTLQTFINLGYDRFFEPAVIAQMRASAQALLLGSDVTVEVPIRSLDGMERWLRIVARAFPGGPGHDSWRVFGFGEDITEPKRLEKALEDATHREQRRLGHEIHDGLGQELAGLTYLASSLATEAQRTNSMMAGDLSTLVRVASHAIETCRDIARGISPLTESRGSLVESIRRLVERAAVGGCARVSFETDERAPAALSWEALSHLHRIVQEAIGNALRHADAQQVRVAIAIDPISVRVEVVDDGRGFAPSETASIGVGLDSMRQRAAAIGAALRVESRIGGGTAIICECPQPCAVDG
jgi:PAS domain S-box-containing protein